MFTRRKRIAALALGGLLGVLMAAPYLIPMSHLIPDLEAHISGRIHEPVKIGGLRLVLLPLPHLVARDITVGKAPLVQVDALTLRPGWLSLLSTTTIIREIRLDGVRVKPEVFSKADQWVRSESGGQGASATPSVRIDRITLRGGEIRFRDFSVQALDADIQFSGGKATEIRASQQGDRLRVTARPQSGGSWTLDVVAHNWSVPGAMPLHFDRLEGAATLTASGISSKKASGVLYGGTITGPVAVNWKPTWSASGELEVKTLAIEPVVALLKRDLGVSGSLTADPHFTLRGPDAASLLDSIELESDFSVEHGLLQKVDLVAATRNPFDKQAGKGGKTEFNQLVGHVVIGPGGYQFSDIEVSSGLLKATGDVVVGKDQKLDGRIYAEVKGTGTLFSIPFNVSGTVAEPSLFPTTSAIAAAVAGSVLLPGIGTAAGIKASQFADMLFGPRKPQRKKAEPAQPAATRSGRQ
jgi:uncharacterized protein involved in outer membrane biogenesis